MTKNGNTMTSNEELISEARASASFYASASNDDLVDRLVDALEAASQTRVVDNADEQLETVLAAQLEKWMPNHPTREVAVASAWFRAGWKARNAQNGGRS